MSSVFTIYRVDSLHLPAISPYRTLRRPEEHRRAGIFVAEGEKVVRRLLTSGLEVVSLLLTPGWLERLRDVQPGARSTTIEAFVAKKELLREIVGYDVHQGIMAVGRIPAESTLTQVPVSLAVALDGLNQPENVGIVVRSCAGFAVDVVIVGEHSSSPYLRRAVQNSMGTVFRVPVIHATDLATSLRWLQKNRHTRAVVADGHASKRPQDGDLRGNVCIFAGNEDTGVSQPVKDLCDERLAIRMENGLDSLNVASAVAVFLFEARRQRELHQREMATDAETSQRH